MSEIFVTTIGEIPLVPIYQFGKILQKTLLYLSTNLEKVSTFLPLDSLIIVISHVRLF